MAAGAATAAALPRAKAEGFPFIQKVRAASDQVPYAFIGTGSRGQYLLKHMKETDVGRCVGLCDNWDQNLKKGLDTLGQKVPAYLDYRELLARKDVEAVYIATPLYMHFPITRDALQAGKHVFCEKSLVHKPEEVHLLRALYQQHQNKQVLQVGLQRHYSLFYDAAKEMVAKGMLGNVTHVRGQWHRNSSQRKALPKGAPPNGELDRKINWRMYKEYAGGNTAELASHQIDVADRMFGSHPEFVVGVGGIDTFKDGRDVFDNIQLIYSYPGGRKLIYTSISTNSHLDLLQSQRQEFGEIIMGTAGTIEITIGDDNHPATALWYREPAPVVAALTKADEKKKEETKAGATMTTAAATRGVPLLLPRDMLGKADSFLSREAKFARRWLYSKGIMVPEENRNPVTVSLEDFLLCCKNPAGKKPKADMEVGLRDSTAVILSNLAMEEGRRVYFNEIDKFKPGAAPAGKKG